MPAQDIVMLTQYKYSSHIRSVEQIYPLGHKLTKTQQPPNVSTLQLTSLSTPNSQVHQLTNSRTQSSHQLINPSTCQLKAPSPYKPINSQTQKTHQLTNSKTLQPINPQNLKALLLFYNNAPFSTPFQQNYRLKSRQKATIYSFSCLLSCLFLVSEPAFCTILPFQFGRKLVIYHAPKLTFRLKKPTF